MLLFKISSKAPAVIRRFKSDATLPSTDKTQVLLVDANLRTLKLHIFFNIPKETGLAEVIQAKGSWTDMVHSSRIRKKILWSLHLLR